MSETLQQRLRRSADFDGPESRPLLLREAADVLDTLHARVEALEGEWDDWKADAKRYATNADYERDRREQAESERDTARAALAQLLTAIDGTLNDQLGDYEQFDTAVAQARAAPAPQEPTP